jgi:mannosyltransferase PIG-V
LTLQNRWDAGWYVGIASGGYHRGSRGEFDNAAFFPAFPVALRLTATSLGVSRTPEAWSWTGALLACVMFVLAMCYLYRLASVTEGARPSVAVMVAALYPLGVFFGASYTESLFLLSCVASLWHLSRGEMVRSTLWGLVAGLTRPIGWLLVIPLAWTSMNRRPVTRWGEAFAVLSPVIGVALFCVYLAILTGNPLEWVSAQARWGRHYAAMADLVQDVLVRINRPGDAINAVAGAFALGCVIPIWRTSGAGYALFVALAILLPVTFGGLTSLGRFTAVLFPIYLWLSQSLRGSARAVVYVLFGAAEALAAAMFYTWGPLA